MFIFIIKIRNTLPALLKIMRGKLRAAFSCEHALFISVRAHCALNGLEIRKIPGVLARNNTFAICAVVANALFACTAIATARDSQKWMGFRIECAKVYRFRGMQRTVFGTRSGYPCAKSRISSSAHRFRESAPLMPGDLGAGKCATYARSNKWRHSAQD